MVKGRKGHNYGTLLTPLREDYEMQETSRGYEYVAIENRNPEAKKKKTKRSKAGRSALVSRTDVKISIMSRCDSGQTA